MSSGIQAVDLGFFSVLASAGSLSAAARELGITTPAVSKRLALMESRLGLPLVNRTTRRMGLTPEGELYLVHARRILGEIDDIVLDKVDGRFHVAGTPAVAKRPEMMDRMGVVGLLDDQWLPAAPVA